MAGKKGATTPRTIDASDRLLHVIAAEFPRLHDRQSLLESPALIERFGEGDTLNDSEQRAVTKAIARSISDGSVSELLWPRGDAAKVLLPEEGMIAVSVNLGTMREERQTWELTREGPEPTQERIVTEIVSRSREWVAENLDDGRLPLLLTKVSIIHGSNAFDILVSASYRNPYNLLRYTREVVQVISHVAGTHTMLVAQSYGFPNLGTGV
jgi:hypothetical protein